MLKNMLRFGSFTSIPLSFCWVKKHMTFWGVITSKDKESLTCPDSAGVSLLNLAETYLELEAPSAILPDLKKKKKTIISFRLLQPLIKLYVPYLKYVY